MIKIYCIPLAIVAALSAFQSVEAHETKLPIKDTKVVLTNALFKPIPSELTKMQITKDQTLDSYYKYNANINASAVEKFKQFIPQLFNANKASIKTAGPLSSVVRFDPLVAPSLGMDLNFDIGSILPKDTKISSIWEWKASNYIDGTSYEIQVIDRPKAKPRVRDPRHNDVNNSEDIPVDKKNEIPPSTLETVTASAEPIFTIVFDKESSFFKILAEQPILGVRHS